MTEERLSRLRHEMNAEGIDAIIFPTGDPHGSEYVAPYWQARQWITGFTGSAGTAVVTQDEAALWTDSRYFLQAAQQLQGTGFTLMKDGLADTPSITEWLMRKMSAINGRCVAIDGMVTTYAEITAMQERLGKIGVTIRTNYDAMRMLWHDRPAIPSGEIYCVNKEYIGESTSAKLERIRKVMHVHRAEALVVTDLMEIAWTLNLRGSDIAMTPVFMAFLCITTQEAHLFCNGALTNEAQDMMRKASVQIKRYADFPAFISSLDGRTMCHGATTAYNIYKNIAHVIDEPSPIVSFKAVKNQKEIDGFRQAMRRDGVAMVRFLRWLKPAVAAGGQTEISVSDRLEMMRRDAQEFRDLSFSTICGYQSHGAIVHYTATQESNAPLKPEGLLLIDSGAQYIDGTTDITRTIALGEITDEMRRAYTLVLKANIALATAPFPNGTNGTQLDAIAHSVLWSGGLNYLHGTGHGVGWCLCVHEGPHAIRMDWRPEPLHEGMTVTDEPGVYLEGRFGIRTENTMLVVKDSETEFGMFLKLEPLTLCPIDTTPIDLSLMTEKETDWLNNYHQRVRNELSPLLTDEADRQWLHEATEAVHNS